MMPPSRFLLPIGLSMVVVNICFVLYMAVEVDRSNPIDNRTLLENFTTVEAKDEPIQEGTASGKEERCAINLFGLPRAFESLVLPSMIKNVIVPNTKYSCDYFVHYYQMEKEAAGRSGNGGAIRAEEILLLEQQVMEQHKRIHSDATVPSPVVKFVMDRDTDFFARYQPLLNKIHEIKDPEGKPLYFPWKDKTYRFPTTTTNIIKMWHSIQSAWGLMEQHEKENNFRYTKVAVLRSDVLFVTPLDLYEYNANQIILPGFGKYPVSDRAVWGPRDAIKIWATERFDRLDQHVQWAYERQRQRGYGLHSENFVRYQLLKPMAKLQTELHGKKKGSSYLFTNPKLCFFRVRADETVWVKDCSGSHARKTIEDGLLQKYGSIKAAVESVIDRTCQSKEGMKALDCRTP